MSEGPIRFEDFLSKDFLQKYDELQQELMRSVANLKKLEDALKGMNKKWDAEAVKKYKQAKAEANKELETAIRLEEKSMRVKVQAERVAQESEKTMQQRIRTEKAAQSVKKKTNDLYSQEQAELTRLRRAYANLALAGQENTKEAKQYMAAITKLDSKLKGIRQSMGQHFDDVGKYQKVWKGAGAAVAKFAVAITAIVGAFNAVKQGFLSVGQFADAYEVKMTQAKWVTTEFFKTLRNGDWSNFFNNAKRAAEAARQYAEAIDLAGDSNRALALRTAEARAKTSELMVQLRKKGQSKEQKENTAKQIIAEETTLLRDRKRNAEKALQDQSDAVAKSLGVEKTRMIGYLKYYDIIQRNNGEMIKKILEQEDKLRGETTMTTAQGGTTMVNKRKYTEQQITDMLEKQYTKRGVDIARFASMVETLTDEIRTPLLNAYAEVYNATQEYNEKTRRAEVEISKLLTEAAEDERKELEKKKGAYEELTAKIDEYTLKLQNMVASDKASLQSLADTTEQLTTYRRELQGVNNTIRILEEGPAKMATRPIEKVTDDLISGKVFGKGGTAPVAGPKQGGAQKTDPKSFKQKEGSSLISKLFGISAADEDLINENSGMIRDAARDITDAVVEYADMEIAKQQELVDARQRAVDALTSQLEEQEALQREGAANNADALRVQLEASKAARDQELKELEEAQGKKRAIIQAEIILNTIATGVNMVESISKLIKTSSTAGPIAGPILAAGSVASVLALFLKSASALKSTLKYEDGGSWIEGGRRHSDGGNMFNREVEKGERVSVFSREATSKYNDQIVAFTKAANNGMDPFTLNFKKRVPDTMVINDFSNMASIQQETLQEQKRTNALLEKTRFISSDGKVVMDIHGNITRRI